MYVTLSGREKELLEFHSIGFPHPTIAVLDLSQSMGRAHIPVWGLAGLSLPSAGDVMHLCWRSGGLRWRLELK